MPLAADNSPACLKRQGPPLALRCSCFQFASNVPQLAPYLVNTNISSTQHVRPSVFLQSRKRKTVPSLCAHVSMLCVPCSSITLGSGTSGDTPYLCLIATCRHNVRLQQLDCLERVRQASLAVQDSPETMRLLLDLSKSRNPRPGMIMRN